MISYNGPDVTFIYIYVYIHSGLNWQNSDLFSTLSLHPLRPVVINYDWSLNEVKCTPMSSLVHRNNKQA